MASTVTDLPPLLPAAVRVCFPQTWADVLQNAPYFVPGDITLAALALPEFAGVGTNGTTKLIRSSAVAAYDESNTLVNAAELLDLSRQIAVDFYRWQLAKLDMVFAGVMPWVPDGMADSIEWTHTGTANTAEAQCTTRIQREPWNRYLDLLHSGTPWNDCVSGSVVNWTLFGAINNLDTVNMWVRGELTYSGNNFALPHRARAYTSTLPAYTHPLSANIMKGSGNSALPLMDGVALIVGDRLLVNLPGGSPDNGLYVVNEVGGSDPAWVLGKQYTKGDIVAGAYVALDDHYGSTDSQPGVGAYWQNYWALTVGTGEPWFLERACDAETSAMVRAGMLVEVGPEGTANPNTIWQLTTLDPIALNSTAITFSLLPGGKVKGVLNSPALVPNGTSSMRIWDWNGAAEADTGIDITVHDWLLAVGDTVAVGTRVTAFQRNGRWYVDDASCNPGAMVVVGGLTGVYP